MNNSKPCHTIEEDFVVSAPKIPFSLIAQCCGVFLTTAIFNLALDLKLFLFILAFAAFAIIMLILQNNIPPIYVHKDTICYKDTTTSYEDIERIVCKTKRIKVISNGKVVAKAELAFNNADKFLSWAEKKQILIQY